MTPFIVYALPRSRTFWLSQFLTIGGYHCHHEQVRHLRTLEDARTWLAQDWTGTAETAAAHGWRLARALRPDLRVLVVRRPLGDVLGSLEQWGIAITDELTHRLRALDRRLDQIERQTGVLSVRFADLEREDACGRVFRHCLGAEMPARWWRTMAPLNLQADLTALLRYVQAHRRQLRRLGAAVVDETRALLRAERCRIAGPVVIQEETLADVRRDGEALLVAHAVEVGPRDGAPFRANWPLFERLAENGMLHVVTARSAGRLVGYLMHLLGPSLENGNLLVATQGAFFVARPFRGAGARLASEAVRMLWARGVNEISMHDGAYQDGHRLGALWLRLGARPRGRVYTLTSETA